MDPPNESVRRRVRPAIVRPVKCPMRSSLDNERSPLSSDRGPNLKPYGRAGPHCLLPVCVCGLLHVPDAHQNSNSNSNSNSYRVSRRCGRSRTDPTWQMQQRNRRYLEDRLVCQSRGTEAQTVCKSDGSRDSQSHFVIFGRALPFVVGVYLGLSSFRPLGPTRMVLSNDKININLIARVVLVVCLSSSAR